MSLEMFIMKCLKYDNSSDMCKIVDKKVKKHYHACDAAYTSSETFKKLLQTRMERIDKDPMNLHVYIKEVVDELRIRHKKDPKEVVDKGPPEKKIKLDPNSSESSNLAKPTEKVKPAGEESHFNEVAARKLSKMLHRLQRKIVKLEQKEVDFDEENDSTYIQTQRYKERAVAVYKKLQQVECGVIPKLVEKRYVSYSGTPFPSVNRSIEKYLNKTGQFPDYQEVLKLLRSAYEEEKMNVSPERLRQQAKAAFQTIGEQLQRQRQFSIWNAHSYYLGEMKDPAEADEELDKKLRENKKDGENRISEIINKFADETKDEVPEEVPDNETESKSEDEADDGSEEGTVDESEKEDNFVDDILAGVKNNENYLSENEKESSEDSDGNRSEDDLETEEVECIDTNSESENEDILEIHEQSPDRDKEDMAELLDEVERTENDEKCNMLQVLSLREAQESVLATTNSIKGEAKCESHENNVTPERDSSKPQDRHNGLMQKSEQSKNDTLESKQDKRQLTKYSEVDDDSDNDVIILE